MKYMVAAFRHATMLTVGTVYIPKLVSSNNIVGGILAQAIQKGFNVLWQIIWKAVIQLWIDHIPYGL